MAVLAVRLGGLAGASADELADTYCAAAPSLGRCPRLGPAAMACDRRNRQTPGVYVLGIDIGGTKTAIATAQLDGELIAEEEFRTPKERGPDAMVDEIIKAAHRLANGDDVLAGVGVGAGGPLERLLRATEYGEWR